MGILPVLLALSLLVSAVALLNARREYRTDGKLSTVGYQGYRPFLIGP